MVCTGYDLSACFASRSVVMTVLAMHVLMGNFFFRSDPHIGDLQGEAQGLARQRVVAVQQHDLALDFGDVKHLLATIAAASTLLTACTTLPQPAASADVIAALAPDGRLRAAINFGNPILANKDAKTGEPVG